MILAITPELAEHPKLADRHTVASCHAMIANGCILEEEPVGKPSVFAA